MGGWFLPKAEIHQLSVAHIGFSHSRSLANCNVFPWLMPTLANFKSMWCFCQMTFTGKPSILGEVDLVGNDPEESVMEGDNQISDDLFDDPAVTDISDTYESSEMQNVTGMSSLCPKLFAEACFYRLLFACLEDSEIQNLLY